MQATDSALGHWLAAIPSLGASFEADRARLGTHVDAAERHLAALPAPIRRDGAARRAAALIHDACRRLRRDFLVRHAEPLYAAVTRERDSHFPLAEMAFAAARLVPGLLPTPEQIAAERACEQAAKEGREIDQGLFFSLLLEHPEVGPRIVRAALQPSARALALLEEFNATGRIDLGKVLLERHGVAAHLTVNNPACLNAEDDGLIDAMETAVDLVLLDPASRVGVVRGGVMSHPRYAGKRVFSAGINLKELHRGTISFVDFLLRRELGYISKIARGLLLPCEGATWQPARVEKPWIAAVDGFAIGGGAQLLLVFDHVIAAEDSYFSLPAAREGIVPGVANLRLARRAGARLARQIILEGRSVRAQEPDAQSLFDCVVPVDGIDAAIQRAVQGLDSPAVLANRRMLRLAEEPLEQFRAYMAAFALEQVLRLYSQDVLDKVAPAPAAGEGS